MNILLCSVGRRGELIKFMKNSLDVDSKIIATDNSPYAPALYLADKQYIVPRIDTPDYIKTLLQICKQENIKVVTTLIDPEIDVLSQNRQCFTDIGVLVLAPYEETAQFCFDKFKMYKYLVEQGIKTVRTWGTVDEFRIEFDNSLVSLPIFVKPRTGSGSVGARRIDSLQLLTEAMDSDPTLIIQEYMNCLDLDADVYIDTVSHQAVSAFTKRKLETRIGGASKTISFKDDKLFEFIRLIASKFKFNGPVDMDFFYRDDEYYLSEINPRFGGAYLHAYGAGVDFIKLIENNANGIKNEPVFGNYEDDVVMMMYDSVVIMKSDDLAK